MTFRSYGLSWDEPLFYDYGEALKYAYTPANWFSGNFDVTQSFGSSGTDHANRGPAYQLVAMPLVSLWKGFGFLRFSLQPGTCELPNLQPWHLSHRLASKWMSQWAALSVAALFTFQPLLWGHAFINPKTSPS